MAAAALIGAGGAVGAYGAIKANQDRAAAEQTNADYYREQASYAQTVGDRELYLFKDKAAQVQAAQAGGYAKGGVELTGSPLATMERSFIRASETERAMNAETASRVRFAMLKGNEAQSQSDNYSSFWTNFVSAAPSVLRAGGSLATSGSK